MITPFEFKNKIIIPEKILLIPFFPDRKYLKSLRDISIRVSKIVSSELIIFESFSIITGFIGYPSILTVLNLIENVENKEIVFLGTAGSLNEKYGSPAILRVEEIFPDENTAALSRKKSFKMLTDEVTGNMAGRGVTTDIVQRETPEWISVQKKRGMDFVEMEIFAVASYLDRGFKAFVVLTDMVSKRPIVPFENRKRIKTLFNQQAGILTGI